MSLLDGNMASAGVAWSLQSPPPAPPEGARKGQMANPWEKCSCHGKHWKSHWGW